MQGKEIWPLRHLNNVQHLEITLMEDILLKMNSMAQLWVPSRQLICQPSEEIKDINTGIKVFVLLLFHYFIVKKARFKSVMQAFS